ncbi:MAG: Tat pathway signal protein [Aquincola sp.]|nr:Tat pathway signal protein [Aquincola sp.]MDH5330587.1 Tat pathway signal protein [Aquincola sp.]
MTIGASSMLGGCAPGGAARPYEQAVRDTWRHGQVDRNDGAALRRELVRYATLAPSSHNTQCWKFALEDQTITILPDLSRRCPAVDPDDHHVFVSLGCAAENLVQAALAHGLKANASFDAGRAGLRIALEPTAATTSPLFQAIPHRQSTRAEYDGKALAAEELRQLEQAAAGAGVQLMLLTDKDMLERVLEFVVQGNTVQMNDRAFVDELKAWIRFNASDAARAGDGLHSASSGNPTLPSWLGPLMFDLAFRPKSENDKYARHVRSSAGIAIFVGPRNDKAAWIEVGRVYERFALQATALGVRTAHLNQPIEVAALRPQFANLVGIAGQRPDLVIRFGRGPTLPPSLRRPVQSVLV